MSLLGSGALAMWWDMAPEVMADFEDWHSHEHFPERMGIPGFRRGSRWTSATGGDGVFVMYEVDSHAVLSSQAYLARLNAPTPWSAKLMPHHRNMVRMQCHVLASRGGGVGRHAMTLRCAPGVPPDAEMRARFAAALDEAFACPGLIGVHLLRHETPDIGLTTEQKIRGAPDLAADWVLVATGYELRALETLAASVLSNATLQAWFGGAPVNGLYALSHSATSVDVQ